MRDVVIAGAGPVGLMLACELRLAGMSVLVLEREAGSSTALKRFPFGARGLSTPSIDAFVRRGWIADITPEAGAGGGGAHWMREGRRPAGHFAGIMFFEDDVDPSRWHTRPAGLAGTQAMVEMESLEASLAARACAMGAEIRRGAGVNGLDASDDGVTVSAGGLEYRARWLVGCDGERSTVRTLGGFEFAGTDPEFTGYSVEVTFERPERLKPGRHFTSAGVYTFAPPGTLGLVDFDGGACHRMQPITLAHVADVVRRVCAVDVDVTALHLAATWTDRAFQARAYRKGRVLLAGDAAHIHSPLGGQGLNLGLGDAVNLGWKLAAAIRGDAPPDLLDSYEWERHPMGAEVLDWSRAQVALMRPTPSTRALAAIVRDLAATRDGATYFAERIRGISRRTGPAGAHPLVGCSVPDIAFECETCIADLMRDGRGVIIDLEPGGRLGALAAGWSGRVGYFAGEAVDRFGIGAVLVRPDGVVAWASDGTPDEAEVEAAVTRWFGPAGVTTTDVTERTNSSAG